MRYAKKKDRKGAANKGSGRRTNSDEKKKEGPNATEDLFLKAESLCFNIAFQKLAGCYRCGEDLCHDYRDIRDRGCATLSACREHVEYFVGELFNEGVGEYELLNLTPTDELTASGFPSKDAKDDGVAKESRDDAELAFQETKHERKSSSRVYLIPIERQHSVDSVSESSYNEKRDEQETERDGPETENSKCEHSLASSSLRREDLGNGKPPLPMLQSKNRILDAKQSLVKDSKNKPEPDGVRASSNEFERFVINPYARREDKMVAHSAVN